MRRRLPAILQAHLHEAVEILYSLKGYIPQTSVRLVTDSDLKYLILNVIFYLVLIVLSLRL